MPSKKNHTAVCIWDLSENFDLERIREAKVSSPATIHLALYQTLEQKRSAEQLHKQKILSYLFPKSVSSDHLNQVVALATENYKLAESNKELERLSKAQEKTLARTYDGLRKELFIGAKVHEELLVGQPPKNCPKMECDAITLPSKEIEGDFYDFFNPLPWVYDLVIADVMGKGLPAALVGTAIKTQLTRFATPSNRVQLFNKQLFRQKDLLTPKEIMEKVHQELAEQLMSMEFFASLFLGRFDFRKFIFSYVDCGFTKPIHYQKRINSFELLRGKNFPLGMVPEETQYRCIDRTFGRGDLFIFYSDGVTEARSPEGKLFGVKRLIDSLRQFIDQSPEQLLQKILEKVYQHTETKALDDDFTLIVLKITGNCEKGTQTLRKAQFISDLSQLQSVRDFTHRFCLKAPGDNERFSSQMQLAIDEAFCNIVKHSYKGRRLGEVIIEGELTNEGIIFELADQGEIFSPDEINEPSLAGDRDGGFGLYMIKEIADQVTYVPKDQKDGWNYFRIFKKHQLEEGTMKLSHILKNDVVVVHLHSENLDAKLVPTFKEQVNQIINDIDKHFVVFDLNALQFIDSSGLGSFLSILRVLNSRGGDLKLASMTKPIRTMFEIVRMHKLFEIFNSPEEAVRSFQNCPS